MDSQDGYFGTLDGEVIGYSPITTPLTDCNSFSRGQSKTDLYVLGNRQREGERRAGHC